MKVTTQSYGQFLVNSPMNFTGTYFADTVDVKLPFSRTPPVSSCVAA